MGQPNSLASDLNAPGFVPNGILKLSYASSSTQPKRIVQIELVDPNPTELNGATMISVWTDQKTDQKKDTKAAIITQLRPADEFAAYFWMFHPLLSFDPSVEPHVQSFARMAFTNNMYNGKGKNRTGHIVIWNNDPFARECTIPRKDIAGRYMSPSRYESFLETVQKVLKACNVHV